MSIAWFLALLLGFVCGFLILSVVALYAALQKEKKISEGLTVYTASALIDAQRAKEYLDAFCRKPLVINLTGEQISSAIAESEATGKKKLLN